MERRCVVFDVDDTLYLERDYVRSGFRAAGDWLHDTLGVDDFASHAWQAFERGVRGNIFDVALAKVGVEPAPRLVSELVEVYRHHDPDITLLPDVGPCLDELVEAEVELAVITDGPVPSQRAKIRALGLETWIDLLVVTGEHGPDHAKPSTAAFQLVEATTGCGGAACAYVADNPTKDFQGPAALGWRTVRIRRPGGLHERTDHDACPPQLELPSLERLRNHLRIA